MADTGKHASGHRPRTGDDRARGSGLLFRDPATGLAERRLLEERIGQAVKHAQRKRLCFSLAVFCVDDYGPLESSLGRAGADLLLAELGRRLRRSVRAEDTVAYLGAGAFAALLPGAGGPSEAAAAVSVLLATLREPVVVAGDELSLSASLGVAVHPSDGVSFDELLHNAHAAMRQASDAGGERWRFFHAGLNEERADRLALETGLRAAPERGELFLEYQPLVAAATAEIVGVESLVRWRHPERGVLPPLEFLPVAEAPATLARVGAWVLGEACAQGYAWRRQFRRRLQMSVNVSGRELHDDAFLDTLRRTLRTTGFDPRALELDIAETAALRDARRTSQVLGALRAMGVRVALDDFGTGHASLTQLARLPLTTVKIDRSLVRGLPTTPRHAAVVAAVVGLGRRLGLTVVAEGVETPEEYRLLRAEGCDVVQGFLLSPAAPSPDCTELLRAGVLPAQTRT
jgi:diguanylate cyclase (GGDEF)-like protein